MIGAAVIATGVAMVGGGVLLGRRNRPRSALQMLGFKVMVWLGVSLVFVGAFVVIVWLPISN